MEKQGGDCADHQDQRERLKGEHEAVVRIARLEGRRTAAEEAEDQLGAGLGGALHGQHQVGQRQKGRLGERQLQQQKCEGDLEGQTGDDQARTDRATPLAREPGQNEDDAQPEQGLQGDRHEVEAGSVQCCEGEGSWRVSSAKSCLASTASKA